MIFSETSKLNFRSEKCVIADTDQVDLTTFDGIDIKGSAKRAKEILPEGALFSFHYPVKITLKFSRFSGISSSVSGYRRHETVILPTG